MQGGVGTHEQAPDLMSLGRIDYQPFWIFYRGSELLDDPTQLKGKRIAVGPIGSGTRKVCEKILAESGVTSENATLLPLSAQSAADALKNGTIDALFLDFAPNSAILRALLKNPTVRPMSFRDAEALTRIFPFLTRLVLPRGVIDFQDKIPAADVIVIATTNAVLVRKDIHPALIDLLAKAIMETHNGPGLFQRTGEFPAQTDPEYPVAQSARDFYNNGPSFLNRYLPFWMTNYARRTIAILAAVIAIVLPLFSYVPRLYRGLVNQRLGSMYRRLRAIEANLQKEVQKFRRSKPIYTV